jgi:hypothetical protein
MVIYVPPGDPIDPTRAPAIYDGIASYLKACGIPGLTAQNEAAQMARANQDAMA